MDKKKWLFLLLKVLLVLAIAFVLVNEEQVNQSLTAMFKYKKNTYTPIYNPQKKLKILLLTIEDRDLDYIKTHDINFKKYAKIHNYEYLRLKKCDLSEATMYWCKIYKVLEYLKKNQWDYILWADSDTIITDYNKPLEEFIFYYAEKDIIISSYGGKNFMWGIINYINAGIFLIKNSQIGINFLEDCLKKLNSRSWCIIDNKEQGMYSGICYEEGIMNELLKDETSDYYENSILDYSRDLFESKTNQDYLENFNNNNNNQNNYTALIVHLAGFSNDDRSIFFNNFK